MNQQNLYLDFCYAYSYYINTFKRLKSIFLEDIKILYAHTCSCVYTVNREIIYESNLPVGGCVTGFPVGGCVPGLPVEL